MSPSKLINDRNLKCLEKGEEIWISTPHLLSMRPYAHTQENHAKKGLLSKHATLLFRNLVQSQASHINQPTWLLTQQVNTHPNMLENHDLLQTYHQRITSQE